MRADEIVVEQYPDDPGPSWIYMAGPIGQADTDEARARIAIRAIYASMVEGLLTASGWLVINPYSSVLCAGNFNIPADIWYAAGAAKAANCDAILLLPGWEDSEGVTMHELPAAVMNGLQVFVWDEAAGLIPYQPQGGSA